MDTSRDDLEKDLADLRADGWKSLAGRIASYVATIEAENAKLKKEIDNLHDKLASFYGG